MARSELGPVELLAGKSLPADLPFGLYPAVTDQDPPKRRVVLPPGFPVTVAGVPMRGRCSEEPGSGDCVLVREFAFAECGCSASREVVTFAGMRDRVAEAPWLGCVCAKHASDVKRSGPFDGFLDDELEAELVRRRAERSGFPQEEEKL